MKVCAWCASEFNPRVTYQIYCSVECRELATKEKIAERYSASRRKSRSNKPRKCAGGCGITLSIYNEKSFCDQCMINKKKVDKMLKELKGLFDYEQK
jgi:hypothetical protein